ncbi:MAG TPA: ABC transporter permease, partial [Anaeromyxobacter sp.]|nr:ABC transporter permease [Anaeromyxobacter sp.]
HPRPSAPVVRATRLVLAAAAAETAVTLLHFVHGARTYDDPGRLHVVGPALTFLAVVAVLTWLFRRHPGRSTLGALVVATAVPFVGIFGVFHGGWSHAAKLAAFHAGASREALERVFASADFAQPDDAAFEVSGLLGLVAAAVVAALLVRLVREAHRGGGARSSATEPAAHRVATPPSRPPGPGARAAAGLALRMLLDAPVKSLGTLLGVVVSVFLMTQQLSLLTGILGRVTSFVTSTGVDVWISSLATESSDATDSVPASRVGVAAETPGVAWAAPIVQGVGKVTRPDGVREFVKVMGVEAPRYAGLPRALAPGTTPASLRASGRIFLNWNDRKSFASAEPGDRVEIDGKAAVVAGFFQGMDPHSPYYYVFANIDDARSLTDYPQDRVTYVAVGLEPGERAGDVKARLEARLPDAIVRTRDEFGAMEERYFLVRSPVGLVFGMGSLVAAVIGAAIVAVTLYSTAVDRARDYGTLKAIGARRRDLLLLLLVQAWIFAAAGYGVGIGAFYVVRHLYPELPMVASPTLVLGVAAAALVSCTAASVAAIRRVLQLDPALVFRS